MSETRAQRLAAARAPTTRYYGRGLPEVGNRVRHERSSRKFVRADRGAKPLQREVDVWSRAEGPGLARSGSLKVLHAHVAAAGVAPKTLYRGVALPVAPKRGERVTLPLSSFSTDPRVARRFAHHRAKQVGGKPVVMEFSRARALHVAPLARRYGLGMAEWVGQGEYKVVRGGQMARLVPVKKSMPGSFDLMAARGIGTLRPRTYKDSTLVRRRTASGSLVATRRKAHLG